MAVKGPKDRGPLPPRVDPQAPDTTPREAPRLDAARWPGALAPKDHDAPGHDALLGEGQIGDPNVTAEALMQMGSLVRARHLMTLLARRRGQIERAALVAEVGDLLLALDPAEARRLLFSMTQAGRIVDVYPLEVFDYVHQRRALADVEYGPVVKNKDDLEGRAFTPDDVIRLELAALAVRLQALALEGGPTPGYCLAPGPPGRYHLQFDAAGTFSLLLRAQIRKKTRLERLRIRVEDAESPR
ncbi:MAG: hypothetical protein RIT81_33900 [Deltaproteobacteria bacterium]